MIIKLLKFVSSVIAIRVNNLDSEGSSRQAGRSSGPPRAR
jgi:hypothetical protein